MSVRRVLLFLVSIALAALLIVLLIRIGKVDLRLMLHQLESVSAVNFIKLFLLHGLLVFLSTAKWRCVDAALRRPADFIPSWVASFFVSSAGMALGLILPVQLGMTMARTIGTHTYGRALKRGTAGTLFEQGFDFMIVVFLTVASAVTWLCGGDGVMWTISAVVMIAIALLATEPSIRIALWLLRCVSRIALHGSSSESHHWLRKFVAHALRRFSALQHSGLVNARLVRRLVIISAARFAVVVLFANQTSEATGAHILLWRMAAATPFAVLANVIGVTPGGIGVNELTSVTALHLFGTPLDIASQWALMNRILGTGACFAVAASAFLILGLQKLIAPSAHGAH